MPADARRTPWCPASPDALDLFQPPRKSSVKSTSPLPFAGRGVGIGPGDRVGRRQLRHANTVVTHAIGTVARVPPVPLRRASQVPFGVVGHHRIPVVDPLHSRPAPGRFLVDMGDVYGDDRRSTRPGTGRGHSSCRARPLAVQSCWSSPRRGRRPSQRSAPLDTALGEAFHSATMTVSVDRAIYEQVQLRQGETGNEGWVHNLVTIIHHGA